MVAIDDQLYVEQHSSHCPALKEAGASEAHVAIGNLLLPIHVLRIDIQTRQELIAANHTGVEETCQIIGADSLTIYLRLMA